MEIDKTEQRIPFLSVIVPMFNCGSVIIDCLESIDYSDSEIIVVDDGSTDNGYELVKAYSLEHPSVKLFHKSNGGVSSARNLGISKANGRYVSFVDADDTVSAGGFSIVAKIAKDSDADVVKYSVDCINAGHAVLKNLSGIEFNAETIVGKAAVLNRFDISDYRVHDALFKREIIVGNNLFFNEDLHYREDDVFMGAVFSVAETVINTDIPLYNYTVASDFSSTHNQSLERQRVLIRSGLLAVRYRKQWIQSLCPNRVFPYERFKYMRWVCRPKQAVNAGYSLNEYKAILEDFKAEGVYPLELEWIRVSRFDYSWRCRTKLRLQTFMVNHPSVGYCIESARQKVKNWTRK